MSIGEVGWIVCTGPDRSHMYAEPVHNRKRDAISRFNELAAAKRPCRVYRHCWPNPWRPEIGTVSIVAEANCTA